MRKSSADKNKNLKNNLGSMMQTKYKSIIKIKFMLIIIFSYGLSLYSNGENFPFGMNHSLYEHLHVQDKEEYMQKYKKSMKLTAQAGIKWWRVQFAFRWCDVQPKDSISWDFETEDSLVKWAKAKKLNLLPSIGYTAAYARHPGTGPLSWENRYRYPPASQYWNKYKNYIDTLVKRYKNDIKYWQFSNEPHNSYFLGTPAQYVEMYESTRVALKLADPTAKIVGLCLQSYPNTDSVKWKYYDTLSHSFKTINLGPWEKAVSNLIDSIGSDNIDVVSHHFYYWRIDSIMKWLDTLRNIVGENKPIWITEIGFLHADQVTGKRGIGNSYDTTSELAIYSSDSGKVFENTVFWQKRPKECEAITDTLLNIGDTVILINKADNNKADTILYNGGNLIYRKDDSNLIDTALRIGDSLTIYHIWTEVRIPNHSPDSQAYRYSTLLENYNLNLDRFNNLKIFFFCADNNIHRTYYPPIIRFGKQPIEYLKQRVPSAYSVLDTTDTPYPAYYILKDFIKTTFQNP